MKPAIEVNQLTKKFGSFTAVDRISFSISPGTIFGFLGANGAGKSTTIRMLCGLLRPTSGKALVAGLDVSRESFRIRKIIGYMSQRFSLYQDLTVEENLSFFAGVYGLDSLTLAARVENLKKITGLEGLEGVLTSELPAGWKQRLALVCALLHDPEIIFLDEPTSGVDPVARARFWELINYLADNGKTVFVTTHYLDEAEYCHQLAIIHAGRIIASGSPQEIKQKYFSGRLLELSCPNPLEVSEQLKSLPGVRQVSLFGIKIHLLVEEQRVQEMVANLMALTAGDFKLRPVSPTLEDVFIRRLEEENQGEAGRA